MNYCKFSLFFLVISLKLCSFNVFSTWRIFAFCKILSLVSSFFGWFNKIVCKSTLFPNNLHFFIPRSSTHTHINPARILYKAHPRTHTHPRSRIRAHTRTRITHTRTCAHTYTHKQYAHSCIKEKKFWVRTSQKPPTQTQWKFKAWEKPRS